MILHRGSGRTRVARFAAAVALLAGCGSSAAPAKDGSANGHAAVRGGTTADAPSPAERPTVDHPVRVVADGWVLGRPDEALQLCTGLKLSMPPQCDGPKIDGIADDEVPGLIRYAGVRYTNDRVRLVAGWDGRTLTPPATITEQPEVAHPPAGASAVPCPTPMGGWRLDRVPSLDPGGVADLVADDPELAGFWIARTVPPDEPLPPETVVEGWFQPVG